MSVTGWVKSIALSPAVLSPVAPVKLEAGF